MYIAIDFDGSCVTHEYPLVGQDIGAAPYLRDFVALGAKLILLTMRDKEKLENAVEWFKNNDISLFGVNENKDDINWTTSRKVFADLYIDDAAFGCPLIYKPRQRPYIDWSIVGPKVRDMINGY